jgi:prephenate dehydratase
MTIVTLGPAGTFSHELAVKLYGTDIELLPTIHRIMEEVAEGGVEGLVPLENSEAGGVGATLQGFQEYSIYITAEVYMPIRHHLAAREDPAHLEVIFTHPQTHEQCSNLIEQLGIDVVHTSSNAASALAMVKQEHAGAIVSQFTADLYNLPLVLRDVQNNQGNVTRFVQIASRPRNEEGCTKCSILIDPSVDRAGLLYDFLSIFARHGINLNRIESRPSRRGMGSYIFFIDFELHEGWQRARQELQQMTPVKDLGCYVRLEVPP